MQEPLCPCARARVCVCRSTVARTVSALKDIPEAQDEFLERAAAEASG